MSHLFSSSSTSDSKKTSVGGSGKTAAKSSADSSCKTAVKSSADTSRKTAAKSSADSSRKTAAKSSAGASSLKRSLLFIFALFLFLSLWKLLQSPPAFLLSEEQRFVRFTESIFRSELSGNTLNLHYTLANPSDYEIQPETVSLGSASVKSRQRACAVTENYRDTLKQFDRSKLSQKRQLTYDILLDSLDTELSAAPMLLYDEPLSPTLGVQAQLPILLAEYAFRTKGDIENYLCLLTQIPDYFSSILSFEQEKSAAGLFMSDTCADEVILQCQKFIQDPENNYLLDTFDDKIDPISNLTTDEKIAYKTRNQSIILGYVIPAYQTLISGVAALEGTGTNEKGLYYFPEGQSYYRYLVKSMTGDAREIEEIEETIKTQMVTDFEAIQNLMTKLNAGAASSDSGSSDNTGTISSDPAAMLENLRQKITSDFPLAPSVSCHVKYVHKSLQEHLSPAFYLTPTIDDYKNNVIYINPSSDYSGLELYTTLAHEGYPGHLYQSVYFASTKPDLIRNLLDVGGYTEGWATYVEMYSYSFWGTDAATAIQQRNRSFTLGLASLLDIGIHYHGYSLEDVTSFLEKLGFQKETASSLYNNILQSPANYLKYYVGYLNFCDLRDMQKEKLQDQFSLKEFHKAILEIGPAPFEIIKEQLLS